MTDTRENIETDARPRLSEPRVVDRLIRDFTVETLGIIGRQDFMARLDFECRRMNSLFLSTWPRDDYVRTDWNTPDQLGMSILLHYVIDGETRLGVRDACMLYFSRIIDLVDKDPSEMEPLIGELRDALLGTVHAIAAPLRRS